MTKGLALPSELFIRIYGRKKIVLISAQGKNKAHSLSFSGPYIKTQKRQQEWSVSLILSFHWRNLGRWFHFIRTTGSSAVLEMRKTDFSHLPGQSPAPRIWFF